MLVKNRAVWLFILLLVLWIPTSCSAEWKLLESKLHENAYGTKYYYDTKMSYADGSTSKNPLVVFWGKTVFDGKGDPDYTKLLSIGCPPDTTAVELKYKVDLNNKKAAVIYGVLYDVQGRILSTDQPKNAEYKPISPGTGAEVVWAMIKELHEKGAISR